DLFVQDKLTYKPYLNTIAYHLDLNGLILQGLQKPLEDLPFLLKYPKKDSKTLDHLYFHQWQALYFEGPTPDLCFHKLPARLYNDHLQVNKYDSLSLRKRCPYLRMMLKTPDRKSTRLNSSHVKISYAVFCLKKKIKNN